MHAPAPSRSWALAGVAIGIACLLRPEALCYGLALVVAAPPRSSPLRSRLSGFLADFAMTQLPVAAYNIAHFGTLTGPHLMANALTAKADWLSLGFTIARLWFGDGASYAVAALALGGALAALERTGSCAVAVRLTFVGQLLVVATSLWITMQAAVRALPREGLWATFPALGLALLQLRPVRGPTRGDGSGAAHGSFLGRTALLFLALVWLTAPNDGGAQWGPRYLLPACVPLALLTASPLRGLAQPGPGRVVAIACAMAFPIGMLWVQRSMYRDLRIAKTIHARISSAVGTQAGAARIVLPDVPWLDLLAAAQGPRLAFLYAESETQARSAVQRLQGAAIAPVLIARSATESATGSTEDWLSGSCYRVQTSTSRHDRDLSFTLVACGPE